MGDHLWRLKDDRGDSCQNEANPKGNPQRYYKHLGRQYHQHKDKYEVQELMHYGSSAGFSGKIMSSLVSFDGTS